MNWAKSQLSTIEFSESGSTNMANLFGCSYKGWPNECMVVEDRIVNRIPVF